MEIADHRLVRRRYRTLHGRDAICKYGIKKWGYSHKEKTASRLIEIFEDENLNGKIKRRLPYLFQLAELESSMAGKTGMESGSVRERIIVALLITFGTEQRG